MQHSDQDLAALGLTREDFEGEAYGLFKENEQAFLLFESLRTQWRTGMAGPTGLDYQVIPTVCRLQRIPPQRWKALFEDIRSMEMAVLTMFAENRKD